MDDDRLLNSDEVNLLLDFQLTTDVRWNMLVGTADNGFADALQEILGDRKDMTLTYRKTGCDTLIACAQESPDLLVVDESLPDIDAGHIVACLRNHDSLKDIIALYAAGDDADTGSIPANDVIRKSPIDPAYITRKVTSQLYAGYEATAMEKSAEPGRRWPRTVLNLTAGIELLNQAGEVASTGEVVVENISRSGAAISRIHLDGNTHPHENLKLRIKIDHPKLKNWTADAIVVRLKSDNAAGVKFLDISKPDQIKISELFDE